MVGGGAGRRWLSVSIKMHVCQTANFTVKGEMQATTDSQSQIIYPLVSSRLACACCSSKTYLLIFLHAIYRPPACALFAQLPAAGVPAGVIRGLPAALPAGVIGELSVWVPAGVIAWPILDMDPRLWGGPCEGCWAVLDGVSTLCMACS